MVKKATGKKARKAVAQKDITAQQNASQGGNSGDPRSPNLSAGKDGKGNNIGGKGGKA